MPGDMIIDTQAWFWALTFIHVGIHTSKSQIDFSSKLFVFIHFVFRTQPEGKI